VIENLFSQPTVDDLAFASIRPSGSILGRRGVLWTDGLGGSGSCAEYFAEFPYLLQPEFDIPLQLTASFPVKAATLTSLPHGNYFKVHISAGHYAPVHDTVCSFQSTGCIQDLLSWSAIVRVQKH